MCGLFEKDLLLLVQFYEVAIKIGFLLVEQLGLMENPIDLKHGFPPKWVYLDMKLKVPALLPVKVPIQHMHQNGRFSRNNKI